MKYFEGVLYDTTRVYTTILHQRVPSFRCIDEVHHVIQLKKRHKDLSEEEEQQITLNLNRALVSNPLVLEEYNLFQSLVEVASGLIVKWGLCSVEKYSHRSCDEVSQMAFFDPVTLNEHLLAMDTFWLVVALREPPLSSVSTGSLLAQAHALETATCQVFNSLLSLNQIDFTVQPDIDQYIASKPRLFAKRVHANLQIPKLVCHELDLQSSLFQLCHRSDSQDSLHELKDLLTSLETVYRAFEKAVVSNMASLTRG